MQVCDWSTDGQEAPERSYKLEGMEGVVAGSELAWSVAHPETVLGTAADSKTSHLVSPILILYSYQIESYWSGCNP